MIWLLFPFALIYALITTIRNELFDLKVWKSRRYSKPTIGVGNLSMGGTGKSVVIDYLIDLLKKEHALAVLSRGYNRKTKGFLLADKDATAKTIGDEPFQFYIKNPEIKVAVAEKRSLGMQHLLKLNPSPEVFLWDDVFQHRHVSPKLMILTTTFYKPYFEDYVIPLGTLRERRKGVKRADIVLVTKCPEKLSLDQAAQIRTKLKLDAFQYLFFTKIQYDPELICKSGKLSLKTFGKEKFFLVCGIANPDPIIAYLKEQGYQFESLLFPDHFNFNRKAVLQIQSKAKNKKLLTTEKDFGRLAPLLNNLELYYLPIRMGFVFEKDQKTFNTLIKGSITN